MLGTALKDWKTTLLVGLPNAILAVITAVLVFHTENPGMIDHTIILKLMLAKVIISAIHGLIGKSADKGSDRPQPVVDAKLDHVPPADQSTPESRGDAAKG